MSKQLIFIYKKKKKSAIAQDIHDNLTWKCMFCALLKCRHTVRWRLFSRYTNNWILTAFISSWSWGNITPPSRTRVSDVFTDINNVGKLCRICHRQQLPQLVEYENLPLRVQLTAVLFSLPERPQPDLSQSVCLHEQTCLKTTSNHN